MSTETTWVRYKTRGHLFGKPVEYDVETQPGHPVFGDDPVKHYGVITSPGVVAPCFYRVRTVKNHAYEELGRHVPSYTFMPAGRWSELYERVE